MHRSLKLSVMLALALGSTQVAALQLGQIRVKSALGQPLLAEIPLTPDSPAELHNLSVRLASAEDFARAGLGASRPTVALDFRVTGDGSHKIIRVTSAEPVNDPFLDLLVEVDTDGGRTLREFPILLDPPGKVSLAASRPAAPAQAARAGAPTASAAHGSSAPAAAASSGHRAPAAGAAAAAPGQYTVKSGDTLLGIAHDVAPAGIDTNQMLMALKQANPDAFYRDNINALKSGAVLRVPTADQARALSAAAAMAAVRQQNADWRTAPTGAPTVVADAAARSGASAPGGNAGDRLALVPPAKGGEKSGAGGGQGKGDAALRQDLMRARESLTTLKQQGADLKSRLKDLQDLNDKNQRLLALKDNEIAELQQKLAAARKAGGMPAAAASAATPAKAPASAPANAGAPTVAASPVAAASASQPAAAGSAPATAASAPAVASTTVAPAKPAAKPVAKAPVHPAAGHPAPEEPWYMQPWVWYAGGGAAVLLLLLALLASRRKRAAGTPVRPASSLADRFGALHTDAADEGDAEQDELLDQLAEHPDDIGLHLELVSLYYGRRDVEHFEAAAEAMHAHVTDPQQAEWLDVVAMGQDLDPNHPMFAGTRLPEDDEDLADADPADHGLHFGELEGLDRAGGHEDEQASGFDLDSHAAAHEEQDEMADTAGRPRVSEYHFDFDLTPRSRQARDAASSHDDVVSVEEPVQAGPDGADALAFDLGDETLLAEPASHEDVEAEQPATSWNFDDIALETAAGDDAAPSDPVAVPAGEFSDDPIDTKLDLARAYLDMGDADGARGMLEEVMQEGSQMQKDAARKLLDGIA